MRIVHFADVHIGVENYGRVDPETGLSSRLTDFLQTYDEVVTFALDTRADLVLFCGDAYKSRDPSQTHQREFAKRIARLSAAGIPTFLLVGNHDMPHVVGRATALEIFQTLEVSNVHIGDTLKTHLVETRDGPLQIVAVPWIRRSAFLAREDTRGLSPDQVNEAIQERLVRLIHAQVDSLDSGVPALLDGHLSVSTATTSSEQTMMIGNDPILLKSDVAMPTLDYVALGHIHRHQVLGRKPLVVYAGSLQRVDFGEEADDKGFCVVDLDPSMPAGSRLRDFNVQSVNARRFVTINVKISEGNLDPTASVLEEIANNDIDEAIIRLRIALPGELEPHLRDTDIRAALNGAHYVASVSREVLDRPRARLGMDYSRGLDPKEALRLYLESRDVPKSRIDLLSQHAVRLMEEQPNEEGLY